MASFDEDRALARKLAVKFVCPNSCVPQTQYEHGTVKTLEAFALSVILIIRNQQKEEMGA